MSYEDILKSAYDDYNRAQNMFDNVAEPYLIEEALKLMDMANFTIFYVKNKIEEEKKANERNIEDS